MQQLLIAASSAAGVRGVDDSWRRRRSAGGTDVCVAVETGSWCRRVVVAERQRRRVVLTQVGRLTLARRRHVVVTGVSVDGSRFRQRLQSSHSVTIHTTTSTIM